MTRRPLTHRVLNRVVAHAVLVGLALAAQGSCGPFEASAPRCVDDGSPLCRGDHCEALRTACEKKARLCGKERGECDVELCARAAAAQLAKAERRADGIESKLIACVAREVDCRPLRSCFAALDAIDACEGQRLELRTDTQPILPTRVTDGDHVGVAGVVVLPDDDLDCLRCAFEPESCGERHPGCFSANPAAAGPTDTCLDYRVCLRSCEQTAGKNALDYEQCVSAACDVPERGDGKLEFAAYRTCMFERCEACFTR